MRILPLYQKEESQSSTTDAQLILPAVGPILEDTELVTSTLLNILRREKAPLKASAAQIMGLGSDDTVWRSI